MATRLLLIADTHLPKRAKVLPEQVWTEVEAADVVVQGSISEILPALVGWTG